MLREKEDLTRTLKMLESLNHDHRIAISTSIDAYRREEMMQELADRERSGVMEQEKQCVT